jgi:hypothetical protein
MIEEVIRLNSKEARKKLCRFQRSDQKEASLTVPWESALKKNQSSQIINKK